MKSINNQHFYVSQYKVPWPAQPVMTYNSLNIVWSPQLACLPVNLRYTKTTDPSIINLAEDNNLFSVKFP